MINSETNGGDSANVLVGDDANDTILGLGGNDVIEGLGGADGLNGGAGNDTASYASSPEGVTVRLNLGRGHGGDAAGDTYISIENVTGSRFADSLYGDASANVLKGGRGDDNLNGGDGNDRLVSGRGNDTLEGGAGADRMNGGCGGDVLWYLGSDAGVTVDLSTSTGSGGHTEGDTFINIEYVVGSVHDDSLIGDNSFLNVLIGNRGDDRIEGGGGNGFLLGGADDDTFVFGDGFGHDTIKDCNTGDDTIQFKASVFASFAAVQSAMLELGGDVYIATEGNFIKIENQTLADLTRDDFTFVA